MGNVYNRNRMFFVKEEDEMNEKKQRRHSRCQEPWTRQNVYFGTAAYVRYVWSDYFGSNSCNGIFQ